MLFEKKFQCQIVLVSKYQISKSWNFKDPLRKIFFLFLRAFWGGLKIGSLHLVVSPFEMSAECIGRNVARRSEFGRMYCGGYFTAEMGIFMRKWRIQPRKVWRRVFLCGNSGFCVEKFGGGSFYVEMANFLAKYWTKFHAFFKKIGKKTENNHDIILTLFILKSIFKDGR